MPQPFLTVLMTVYNGGVYLSRAIRSVLSQEYKDFEFLIVDDRSTDDSLTTIESFNDPRIRLIKNVRNIGQTASLNVGLREACGQYIARIDADDLALPHWLECQVQAAQEFPENAVISVQAVVINEKGFIKQLLEVPLTHQEIVLRSLTASPVNHGGCLMKRSVILKYGGYDESFRILADYDLWARMIQGGEKFSSGEKVLMAIRFHEGSISRAEKDTAVAEETKRVFRHHIAFLAQMGLSDIEVTLLWELCYKIDSISFQDMDSALGLLQSIGNKLCLKNGDKSNTINHLKARIKIFLVKKLFICLLAGDQSGTLHIYERLRHYCPHSSMAAFFLQKLFLGSLGEKIPALFDQVRRLRAVLSLKQWVLS